MLNWTGATFSLVLNGLIAALVGFKGKRFFDNNVVVADITLFVTLFFLLFPIFFAAISEYKDKSYWKRYCLLWRSYWKPFVCVVLSFLFLLSVVLVFFFFGNNSDEESPRNNQLKEQEDSEEDQFPLCCFSDSSDSY